MSEKAEGDSQKADPSSKPAPKGRAELWLAGDASLGVTSLEHYLAGQADRIQEAQPTPPPPAPTTKQKRTQ